MADSLYLIAILPPPELSRVLDLERKSFSEKYHTHKALKVMPHITLIAPFKRPANFETEIHLNLQDYFSDVSPFQIEIKGYGSFQKASKVIFYKIEKSKELLGMHQELVHFMRNNLKFSAAETSYMYHPHITIAYRDLTDENFEKAWAEYETKEFTSAFTCDKVYLLKHDYSRWQILSVFNLGKS